MTITATYKFNHDKNGIEIYFSNKPNKDTLTLLKSKGFRWAKYNKCWYAKQTDNTINFAKEICSSEDITETTNNIEYEEINIDDNSHYTVSPELSKRENDGNWIFRTKEIDHNQELQNTLEHYTNKVKEVLKETNNKSIQYQLKNYLQGFKKRYHTNYVKMLEVKANNPSWAVTGRAGLNTNKYNKAMDRYHNLMGYSVELTNKMDKKIKQIKYKIQDEQIQATKQAIENELKDIDINNLFTTKTLEFEYMGTKVKKRCYVYENFFICKVWGMFRVFNSNTGNEVKTTLNTLSKLPDAKKYVLYLVKKNQEKAS